MSAARLAVLHESPEARREALVARRRALAAQLSEIDRELAEMAEVSAAKLTNRQREVVAFIARYTEEHGRPPSVREVGTELGLSSQNNAAKALLALAKKGVIEWTPGEARSLRVLAPAGVGAASGGAA